MLSIIFLKIHLLTTQADAFSDIQVSMIVKFFFVFSSPIKQITHCRRRTIQYFGKMISTGAKINTQILSATKFTQVRPKPCSVVLIPENFPLLTVLIFIIRVEKHYTFNLCSFFHSVSSFSV